MQYLCLLVLQRLGKSTLCFYTCYRDYKRYLFRVRFANMFRKLFKLPLEEEGALYSNIPVRIKEGYIPLTRNMLLGKERFIPNSFIYCGEVSLVADSMSFKNMDAITSEEIMLMNKLARTPFC